MVQSQDSDIVWSTQGSDFFEAAINEIARQQVATDDPETQASVGSTIGSRVATRAAQQRVLLSQANAQLSANNTTTTAGKSDCIENQAPSTTAKVAGAETRVSSQAHRHFMQLPSGSSQKDESEINGSIISTTTTIMSNNHDLSKTSIRLSNGDIGPHVDSSTSLLTPPPTAVGNCAPLTFLNPNSTPSPAPLGALHRGLVVQPATEWRQNLAEDYKMSSPTRGFCLIINNVEFSLNIFERRKGSDKDAHRFKEIFKQLGFEVECKRNATADKMRNLFKQKSTLCSKRHDALVVILLSHGTETGIYGSDGIEVDLNDILSYFDNKKCKAMQNKPKVFIVQACRGRRTDYGVQAHETQSFFSQPDTQLADTQLTTPQTSQAGGGGVRLSRWTEVDKHYNPTRTDMILCFASHAGFVSTRDEDEGSWLGAALAHHLAHEAHHRHLQEIFNMASRDVRLRRSNDGLKQVLEVTTVAFDKNLYFNPGLVASTPPSASSKESRTAVQSA